MIYVNEAYKNACDKSDRDSYIIAKYGQFDKTIKGKISEINIINGASFSNNYKTYNDIKETTYNYITCEPNRVKLNNTFFFISNKTKPNSNENIASFSSSITNENGYFNENGSISGYNISFNFNSFINTSNLLLYFQEVCSKISVSYIDTKSNITKCNVSITNNTKKNIEIIVPENKLSEKINKISIDVYATKEPYRIIKFNEIDFGNFKTFTNEEIVDLDIIDELSIDSGELSSNSLNLTVNDTKGEYNILNPNNKLEFIQEKQEITIYHYLKVVNGYKEIPLGTFLLKEFKSRKNKLEIEAYDDTYFMNKMYYGSKFYVDTPITQVLQDLFTYFDYTNFIIDEELNDIKLTGYVPNVEFKEALRLIAEASCSVINKTRYGKTYIFKTYDPSVKTFTKRLQFKTNHEKNLFNNVIDINEYSFKALENQEIYNANLDVGQHIVLFNKYPVLESTITKKDESNNNYEILKTYATTCIVNVINKTDVILKATLMEQSKVVKRVKKNENITTEEYAINKIDNSLITTINSNEVAQWKLNRGNVKYNFDTILLPYIEVGDTCIYETNFNTKNTFIPTKIEFNKSLIQNIEGE